MKKICQVCNKDFEIAEEDLKFYKKIKVLPPTFCPKCRLVRRLVWRNERSLYKRTCDLCKESIISMHKINAEFPVYCHNCWWSDKWSPFDYDLKYDFNIPFFEQFKKLQKTVPRPALYAVRNINSEYTNHSAHNKNCYLIFGSWFDENCSYGQSVLESRDCLDCLFIRKCELCFKAIDCSQCSNLLFGQNCTACADSAFLYDCRNCQNCLFCHGLRNKNYHVFNKPVSREEFNKIKEETFYSFSALQKASAVFKKTVEEQAIHKFMTGEHNHNVSGEFISNSKNVRNSYFIDNGENERYAVRGGMGQKDTMDAFGVHSGELCYECNNIDFSSRCFFSINGENNMNGNYLVDCDHLNNSFGCISVRKKEYCILNKQYSKEKYEELLPKIVEQMENTPFVDQTGKTYGYGEFFPPELAPFPYNKSIAQEYFPILEKDAKSMGYNWDNIEDKIYTPTKNWKDLPETIKEVNDSILSESILCQAWDENKNKAQEHNCTKTFKITANELVMYNKWSLPLPRTCPNTRYFEMFHQRNLPVFWHRKCMKEGCQNEFETSYSPERPEIVYCETCYQQEIY